MVTNDALQAPRGQLATRAHQPAGADGTETLRMFTIGGGTAQILRTVVASRILDMKLPQTRTGYLRTSQTP